MPRRLLVVERRLWLRGKGLILHPGVTPLRGELIRAGDQVVLRRPDGSSHETMIRGTSTASGPGSFGKVQLLLDAVGKDDVPIGTEIWTTGP